MSTNENFNNLLDNIINHHKKQLNEIKRNKHSTDCNKVANTSLIKEIDDYNPDFKINNLERNKSTETLQLNFNYKSMQQPSVSVEPIYGKNRNENSMNPTTAGKIRHKNETDSYLKYNISNFIPLSNVNNVNEKGSDALKNFENLKTSKDYLLINNTKLNEEIQFLKDKINKKKQKIRNFREKAFLLDQRLHNEEKKNLEIQESNFKLKKTLEEKLEEYEIVKDRSTLYEKIVEYFIYFLNKIQNLYPCNFKNKEQRNFLQQNEKNLDWFREHLIELENFIVKGIISSNKIVGDNPEERIKILNEKIFDLKEENKLLNEKLKLLDDPLRDTVKNEENRTQEFNKLKEFEFRLAEIENQLTSKKTMNLAKLADYNTKEELDKKFNENLLTKNNMITGSSGEEINILNSKISDVVSENTESRVKQSEAKEDKKEKDKTVKTRPKTNEGNNKKGNIKQKK